MLILNEAIKAPPRANIGFHVINRIIQKERHLGHPNRMSNLSIMRR
jgi:hypothetical protein